MTAVTESEAAGPWVLAKRMVKSAGIEGVRELLDVMAQAGLQAHWLNVDGTVGARVSPRELSSQVNVVFRR